jgi:serine/threonine protein kinase
MNETSHTPTCPQCGALVAADAPEGLCPRCLVSLNFATQTEFPGDAAGSHGTKVVKAPLPAPDELAKLFPQLEILECLGRGGMGAVYKARQPKLDRFVALKILTPERQADAQFRERFEREARTLARLSHPNIVAVYDFGEVDGYCYLLMEFVDGLTLRQLMQSRKLTPEEALGIVPKICGALEFAHGKGVVHRDIKPENILLDRAGQVKIADFGIAKILQPGAQDFSLTGAKDVVGTPHYMAPEQVEQPAKVDHRADIFSLGVVFYEMLTGELPLGKFAPPSRKVQIDVRLDEIVLHALEKEPERRYQHASEVKTAVETIANSPGLSAAAGLSKSSLCCVSTPEYLRTFRGRYLFICQGKGELALSGETLSFKSGWQVVTIPLPSIQTLARGDYPLSAKPIPLNYIAVTYVDRGVTRTLLFTPVQSRRKPVWETNKIVAEWLLALLEAIQIATGRTLTVGHADLGLGGYWAGLVKTYLLSMLVCTVMFSMIPVILLHRLPNRLSEVIWGPLVPLLTLVFVYVIQWWVRFIPGLGCGDDEERSEWISGARWVARIGGTLLLVLFGIFIVAEGLPPVATQPEGVQLNFVALGLMLLGFIIGWKREGTAALLVASGWTLWHISEGRMEWDFFQTPLVVAGFYGFCWWTTRGRRTGVAIWSVCGLAIAFSLGWLFVPTNVFVHGVVRDAATRRPVPQAELRLLPRPASADRGDGPNARSDNNGRFTLYLGWFTDGKEVALSAPGYASVTTHLGPRGLGERNVSRDFELRRAAPAALETQVPPVVIETFPASGTTDVDPALTELRVTFSKPMREGGYSWAKLDEGSFPTTNGESHFLEGRRTCVLPVKLQPGRVYATWINVGKFQDFQGEDGQPAVPYLLIFETRK